MGDPGQRSARRSVLASLGAVGGILAAASCCLPILPFAVAAGLAGGSAFLSAARPYLLGVSVLLAGYGFYEVRRARKCRRRPSVVVSALVWLSMAFVLFSILFPQAMANAAANWLPRGTP